MTLTTNTSPRQPHNPPFNWTLVLVALIAITIIYGVVSTGMRNNWLHTKQTVYCYYNTSTQETGFDKQECTHLKIISREMNKIDWGALGRLNVTCDRNELKLPDCSGENYFFSNFDLVMFCQGCNVNGIVCGVHAVTYQNVTNDKIRDSWEKDMFTETNLTKRQAALVLAECDI